MIRLTLCLVLSVQLAYAEEITIHADVSLQKRASERSRSLLAIEAGETAELLAQKPGWIKVRVRGQIGWVPQDSMVEVFEEAAPPEVAAVEEEPAPVVDEPVVEELREAPRALELQLAAGLTVITQGFRARGDNYNLGVTAATLALAVGYTNRVSRDVSLGAEVGYTLQKAMPGIRSTDPETGDAITTAFSIHDAALRFVAGYDVSRVVLIARAGVRYHAFQVAGVTDEVANPSRIPSEIRLAPTLGAGLAIPHVTSRLGLRFIADAFAARTTQTPGQEDGVKADAAGVTAESSLGYRWHPGLDLRVTYVLGITATDFGEPDPRSARAHAGTSVTRFDVAHGLTVGIAKGF